MKQRSYELEMLDDETVSAEDVHASLDFMVFVNRFFGGRSAVIDFFKKASAPPEFTVLDLGTGSGDIPHALVEWGRRNGKTIRVTAIDVSGHCLDYANRFFSGPGIIFKRHSALRIGELGAFDYVMSSMFFHHLKDDEIIQLLRDIRRAARLGFVVNDLRRGAAHYAAAVLLSSLTGRRMIRHDAALSVARGFREEDWRGLCRRAGIEADIAKKPWFRIVLQKAKWCS